MDTRHLTGFLLAYCIASTFGVSASALYRWAKPWVMSLLTVYIALGAGVVSVAFAQPGENAAVHFVCRAASLDRTYLLVLAAGLAVGLLAGATIRLSRCSYTLSGSAATLHLLVTLAFGVLLNKENISQHLPTPHQVRREGVLVRQTGSEGVAVEKVAELSLFPTSVALDRRGHVYIAGYSGLAYRNGVVVRVSRQRSTTFREKRVAEYLNRPHGIAFHNGDLYVSRAGQFSRASNGRVTQEDTGAVTRLRDLDGDGVFEFCNDVITGLPGAQLPDGLHQNNGLCFDKEGRLYVTVGAPSDHGPTVHKYAGTIIRADPDEGNVEVLARGFRNPYDVVVTETGAIFCTDNDASNDPGDELNLVVPGQHYGHPYTAASSSIEVTGTVDPLLRMRSAQGLAYAPKGSLPRGYDQCLYIAAYGEDRIYRVELSGGNGRDAAAHFFASVPRPIDVVVGDDNDLYVCSHESQALYRVSVSTTERPE